MRKRNTLKVLRDIPKKDLKNKRVLLRADFNVPIGNDGIIDSNEDWRIRAVIPTIEYLLRQDAKIIILAHLGRPKGKIDEKLRLDSVQDRLSELLDLSIAKMPDCVGKEVENAVVEMTGGEILILENLRFHLGEESNDKMFAEELAKLGDIYINDAFSDCHRNHASIVGITKFLPAYAGLLLEKEFEELETAKNPEHPAVAVIGGAKIETKLPVVDALAKTYDYVLVGGMIANEINKNRTKYSLGANVILPDEKTGMSYNGCDIGTDTADDFIKIIEKAKTIIWNGPVGKYEEDKCSTGTRLLINAIGKAYDNSAKILIGGGETINAIQKFNPALFDKKNKKISISTGGGAMLEFLAGKSLPGIDVLEIK